MKRILFLLLLTVSVYGQNPSRFAKIQITGNSNSGTATKVNVQEANGEVNTQTINTGFNKNIGLGGSDIVGATTLLNQYSTTPVDWTATAFNSGQVVFYGGKQWIAKIATVAGDVPNSSPKWEEITFESLANKTVAVDQTIINGSTNAVSGNAVFDGLENTISKISKGLISGDSTIAQYLGQNAVASYLVTPKDILEGNVITDISVPGNTIAQQKTAWLALSDKNTYDYVIVQIGLNDVGFTESNATVIARLQDYINTINIGKKASCKVIIGEMLPCRARWDFLFGTTNGAIAQLQWEALNESIRGEGASPIAGVNGRVSNHVKMLRDEFGNLAGIYDTGDFIHETNDARSLIASQYRSVLNNFNFLKIAKSTFFDDYLKKGFRSSDTFSLPNSSAGIGFNTVKLNNTLRFSENGYACFINSDDIGRLKFSVSSTVNSTGYGTSVTFTEKLTMSSVGIGINGAMLIGSFNVKQGTDKNLAILDGDLDATAVQLNAFNDAGSLNVPMEFKSSKFVFNNGRVLVNKPNDNGVDKVQVNGTISASPAVSPNQVPTLGQVQAIAGRPYKVYTAVLTQQNTNAPVATVLENTLGGTVTYTYISTGIYEANLAGVFTNLKTTATLSLGQINGTTSGRWGAYSNSTSTVRITTLENGLAADGRLLSATLEIRVYN